MKVEKDILCLTNIDELIAGGKEPKQMHDPSFAFKTWIYPDG